MSKLLYNKAKQLVGRKELTTDVTIGHVGCALKTKAGNIYTGISMGTSANLGFCAEVCAIADMIKHGETEVAILVGVGPEGAMITPCGRCRELLFQIDRKNLATKVMVGKDKTVTLADLLPHRWQEYWPAERV